MSWTAIVPLKTRGERKSRLAERLSATERADLSQRMFDHVARLLSGHSAILSVIVLADERPAGWGGAWVPDQGRGLNGELEAARERIMEGGVLVLHADLPLLDREDIDVLLDAATTHGAAIAPDRHGTGTNALALDAGRRLVFRFGVDSFARHREQLADCGIVRREGFALDLDTPEDLDLVIAAGAAVLI
jgi:2-phospho-L-lactate/phosphoenolpyruvate guanylyltransferase